MNLYRNICRSATTNRYVVNVMNFRFLFNCGIHCVKNDKELRVGVVANEVGELERSGKREKERERRSREHL